MVANSRLIMKFWFEIRDRIIFNRENEHFQYQRRILEEKLDKKESIEIFDLDVKKFQAKKNMFFVLSDSFKLEKRHLKTAKCRE